MGGGHPEDSLRGHGGDHLSGKNRLKISNFHGNGEREQHAIIVLNNKQIDHDPLLLLLLPLFNLIIMAIIRTLHAVSIL